MGAPRTLSAEQLQKLHSLTRDKPETERGITVGANGTATVDVPMRTNDIALVTLQRLPRPSSKTRFVLYVTDVHGMYLVSRRPGPDTLATYRSSSRIAHT
jgi:hypothetical protein